MPSNESRASSSVVQYRMDCTVDSTSRQSSVLNLLKHAVSLKVLRVRSVSSGNSAVRSPLAIQRPFLESVPFKVCFSHVISYTDVKARLLPLALPCDAGERAGASPAARPPCELPKTTDSIKYDLKPPSEAYINCARATEHTLETPPCSSFPWDPGDSAGVLDRRRLRGGELLHLLRAQAIQPGVVEVARDGQAPAGT